MTQFVRERAALCRYKRQGLSQSCNALVMSYCLAYYATKQSLTYIYTDNAITLLFYDPQIHVSFSNPISFAFDIRRSVTVSSNSTHFKMLKYFIFDKITAIFIGFVLNLITDSVKIVYICYIKYYSV